MSEENGSDRRVVSINGCDVTPGKPDPGVVKVLEELLEMARSGEIVAIAAVSMHQDKLSSWRTAGRLGGYSIIGGTEVMKGHLIDVSRKYD